MCHCNNLADTEVKSSHKFLARHHSEAPRSKGRDWCGFSDIPSFSHVHTSTCPHQSDLHQSKQNDYQSLYIVEVSTVGREQHMTQSGNLEIITG